MFSVRCLQFVFERLYIHGKKTLRLLQNWWKQDSMNNVLLPTLFTVVNNIEQYCYTRFRLNNIVQHCWQVATTWAAKHCSILLSSGLGVFCRVEAVKREPQTLNSQNWPSFPKFQAKMLGWTSWPISSNWIFMYKLICYIVSVKVQFFCLPIGQNRVTCRSTKRHVQQPVRNQTFIDRSIIKWVQYACVSTMKFQSSFLKLFTKHLRRSIYPLLVSN
jgi:hypothetical protein